MKLSEFKFEIPNNLIALRPAENRDESRLMVIHKDSGKIEHKVFKDVVNYFNEGDIMVGNDPMVSLARLYGRKEKTGAKIEVFLLRELNAEMHLWDVLVDRPRCGECPVAAGCIARRDGRQGELPSSKPRAAVPERTSTFVLLHDGARLLLERRPPSGLWGGLLVPPQGEAADVLSRLGLTALATQTLSPLKHMFTHFRLTLLPVLCSVAPTQASHDPSVNWVALTEAADAGVPTPIRKLIRQVASAAD